MCCFGLLRFGRVAHMHADLMWNMSLLCSFLTPCSVSRAIQEYERTTIRIGKYLEFDLPSTLRVGDFDLSHCYCDRIRRLKVNEVESCESAQMSTLCIIERGIDRKSMWGVQDDLLVECLSQCSSILREKGNTRMCGCLVI